jgi:Cu/Ag efflux protein CusF
MKIARTVLAAAAFTIVISTALAQQALSGTITTIDRINGTVAIRQTQSGTTGANTGGAADEFKVQAGISLDKFHAGDKVTFSAAEKGGVKTLTKIQQQ